MGRTFTPDAPNRARPQPHQLEQLFDELQESLDILRNGRPATREHPVELLSVFDIIELSRRAIPDGYARSLRATDSGPGSVLDDELVPMPPVADPVGELVANALMSDTRVLVQNILRGLRGGLGDVRMARAAQAKASPPSDPEDNGEPGCRVHATLGSFEAVEKAGRCAWCYDFWNREGVDPPEDILRARIDGKRITTRHVREALAASAADGQPHRGKRRRAR